MNEPPVITVLFGGVGPERAISLQTGRSVCAALREVGLAAVGRELTEAALPDDLDPSATVLFPALHGEFGEDGRIQELMEARGFAFCGSSSVASRLCIHKGMAKRVVRENQVGVIPGLDFSSRRKPGVDAIIEACGTEVVLKPEDQGSSVGLRMLSGRQALEAALDALPPGRWLAERRVRGRELSIGVLDGLGMGIVELLPEGGVYDYEAKYTAGKTEYRYPAELPAESAAAVRRAAETVFACCGCRDFARVDFMLSSRGEPFFLEINTIPGLTPTSLLPKSASCVGFSFPKLGKELVRPALGRFNATRTPS